MPQIIELNKGENKEKKEYIGIQQTQCQRNGLNII